MKELIEQILIRAFHPQKVNIIFKYAENEYRALITHKNMRMQRIICTVSGDSVTIRDSKNNELATKQISHV